jgi:hypothetical protein
MSVQAMPKTSAIEQIDVLKRPTGMMRTRLTTLE